MSKKGENIYKRKDGRWEARYIKGYRPNGKTHYGYCYGKTYREAKSKCQEAKTAVIRNNPVLTRNSRFSFYCDSYLSLTSLKVKHSTSVKYYGIIENHIKPFLGGMYTHNITTNVIEDFTRKLLYEKNLSPKTAKDILIVLRSILKYTTKTAILPHIDIFYPKQQQKEMRVLTKEEQFRLVSYLSADMDRFKFGTLLAILTGMRLGEICALKWNNISFKNKTIKICSTIQRLKVLDGSAKKTKLDISNPKSNTSFRIIPITDYIADICKNFYIDSPDCFVISGNLTPVDPRTMQYRFSKYVKDLGLEDVHFHTLRHTFATRCVEVGFEIKSLSEILGHATPKITLERYVHSSLELKRDNMNKLCMFGG